MCTLATGVYVNLRGADIQACFESPGRQKEEPHQAKAAIEALRRRRVLGL